MFGIFAASLIFLFGVYLKITKNPGYKSSKKFAWLFIILGVLSFIGKLTIMYQKGEL